MTDRPRETDCSAIIDVTCVPWEADRAARTVSDESAASSWSYRVKIGHATIRLDYVEYRILEFLASKPYHAFTPRRIAEAVATEDHPVTEETLDRHIASLRDNLGFFSDYIQSVPYIGYRFKA